jgi:hypothetical protein
MLSDADKEKVRRYVGFANAVVPPELRTRAMTIALARRASIELKTTDQRAQNAVEGRPNA